MTEDQEERLVGSWEAIARALGEINETARSAISKQWPDARQPREGVITRVPTAEDKIKAQTGNTDGPIEEWLGEFDPDEEIGPRTRAWDEAHRKPSGAKASTEAGGQGAAGPKASRRRRANAPRLP